MKVQGAVISEQGITFAIVIVKLHVVNSANSSNDAIHSFSSLFPSMPITLMGQDSNGTPKYRGRKDIVNFLSNIHPTQIPWKEYTFN